jgi:diamine N-acetyltransferase
MSESVSMETTLTLREITKDNWRAVTRLELDEAQKHFVAPNWYSIIEAIFSNGDLHSRAIYDVNEIVGYTMFGVEPERSRHWIVRLMIAKPHQGKGYGRAAMRLIINELKRLYQPNAIYISFEPQNTVARTLYESMGFTDTGEVEDGELLFKLAVSD